MLRWDRDRRAFQTADTGYGFRPTAAWAWAHKLRMAELQGGHDNCCVCGLTMLDPSSIDQRAQIGAEFGSANWEATPNVNVIGDIQYCAGCPATAHTSCVEKEYADGAVAVRFQAGFCAECRRRIETLVQRDDTGRPVDEVSVEARQKLVHERKEAALALLRDDANRKGLALELRLACFAETEVKTVSVALQPRPAKRLCRRSDFSRRRRGPGNEVRRRSGRT